MFNKVILIGRTTSEAELRYTQGVNQKAVAQVTLAVNRPYKSANGEREADFIRLVIWGENAERFSNWIKKGYIVSVEGVLRTRSYDNPQGQRVYVTEVIVTSFVNLTKRDDNQGQSMEQNQGFGNGNDTFGGGFPIPDDDLPF
jgi:single-strand DNA-binding protein